MSLLTLNSRALVRAGEPEKPNQVRRFRTGWQGRTSESLNSKAVVRLSAPWVRIPPSPPVNAPKYAPRQPNTVGCARFCAIPRQTSGLVRAANGDVVLSLRFFSLNLRLPLVRYGA